MPFGEINIHTSFWPGYACDRQLLATPGTQSVIKNTVIALHSLDHTENPLV